MGCDCSQGPSKLIYACSGAANTGLLSDQVARVLAKEGWGKMTCLAALGAELAGFQASAAGSEVTFSPKLPPFCRTNFLLFLSYLK